MQHGWAGGNRIGLTHVQGLQYWSQMLPSPAYSHGGVALWYMAPAGVHTSAPLTACDQALIKPEVRVQAVPALQNPTPGLGPHSLFCWVLCVSLLN